MKRSKPVLWLVCRETVPLRAGASDSESGGIAARTARTKQTRASGNRRGRIGLATRLGVAGLALSLVASPGAADAAIFTVDGSVDLPDVNPGDGLCEESPGGDCTLRAAVMEANALSGDDTISIPAGTFTLVIPDGPPFDDSVGDLDIRDDLHILGAGAGVTILDADGIDRMFIVDPAQLGGFAVEIVDLTIRNGNASGGGAIWNLGTLELGDCTLESNTAVNAGGAISNSGAGDLTVTRCSIVGNLAQSGGGIANFDPAALRIRDSLIEGNTASFTGGGINNDSIFPAGTTIERSTIRGNFAQTDFEFFGGGGIQNHGLLRVFHSTISDNQATQADGGGIASLGGSADLVNTTVSGNSAASEGGGIYGGANLSASTITANSAPSAGGVFGPVSAQTSIFAANVGGNCSEAVDEGCEWPNLDSGSTCGLPCPGSLSNTDPLLGPLAANGGPTETHALPANSPAIDAANPAFGCPFTLEPGGGVGQLSEDQRGQPRPIDGDGDGTALCDFGAFEAQLPIFTDGFESGDTTAWSATVP